MRRRARPWLVSVFLSSKTVGLNQPNFSSVNVPWPEKGMGDAEYIYAFQKVVMPIAMEFAPDLIISTYSQHVSV
jgi:acetoin utilization deacetylase AcuC-like enzyme